MWDVDGYVLRFWIWLGGCNEGSGLIVFIGVKSCVKSYFLGFGG